MSDIPDGREALQIRARLAEARRISRPAGEKRGRPPLYTETHCARGHAWTLETLHVSPRGRVECRVCSRERSRARDERIRERNQAAGANSVTNSRKTHCKWGHEFTEENTYLRPRGGRMCKICMREARKRLYRSRAPAEREEARARSRADRALAKEIKVQLEEENRTLKVRVADYEAELARVRASGRGIHKERNA